MTWHAHCYRSRRDDNYPIATLEEMEGERLDPREQDRYKYARSGDNFMCPFQCDICHFRNIQLRDPSGDSLQDKNLLVSIRRANLDAFWGRSEGTVGGNRREVRKMLLIAEDKFGMRQLFPDMGPHHLEDKWGMGLAVVLLERSKDKGRNDDTVQFETVRKFRSTYGSMWGASIHALSLGVLARDKVKTFVTNNPGYTLWFERFMKGMHNRMGDIKLQDTAITNKLMHAIMEHVEADYHLSEANDNKRFIARAGFFFLACYLRSLRGEEVSRIVRKHFLELNIESQRFETPHCVLPMYGRFKSDGGLTRCYVLRVCNTSRTGFDMKRWVDRIMNFESDSGNFYLLSNAKGEKDSGGVYQPYLVRILKSIQDERVGLVPPQIVVEESYGIKRSFRRGSVTDAGNVRPKELCSDDDIKRNNRWRQTDSAGTKAPALPMILLYTDTLHSVEADLRFSSCL